MRFLLLMGTATLVRGRRPSLNVEVGEAVQQRANPHLSVGLCDVVCSQIPIWILSNYSVSSAEYAEEDQRAQDGSQSLRTSPFQKQHFRGPFQRSQQQQQQASQMNPNWKHHTRLQHAVVCRCSPKKKTLPHDVGGFRRGQKHHWTGLKRASWPELLFPRLLIL